MACQGEPSAMFKGPSSDLDKKNPDHRMDIIRGSWSVDPSSSYENWIPSNSLLVFVSSTFTDTHAERNLLVEVILPQLQQQAKADDVVVNFVDMRYGVRDENTLDHKTWFYCAKELERCRSESAGMFFLSLQGDKYGYRPLPRSIPQNMFEERAVNWEASSIDMALRWYRLDENAQPPEYVLRPLLHLNDAEFWSNVLPQLRSLLYGISFDIDRCPEVRIGQSVTDWETTYALHQANTVHRCVWLHRKFDYGSTLVTRDFSDVRDDEEAAVSLEGLKTLMSKKLVLPPNDDFVDLDELPEPPIKGFQRVASDAEVPSRYISIGSVSLKSYMSRDDEFTSYMTRWEEAICRLMTGELRRIVNRINDWKKDGCGIGINGEALTEIFHHCRWAANKVNLFRGRSNLVDAGMHFLRTKRQRPDSKPLQGLEGVDFAVIGISGSGKTTLMAKLAAEAYARSRKQRQ